jgi:hypothetical protein
MMEARVSEGREERTMETGREEMDNFLLHACNALDKYKGFASTQGARLDAPTCQLTSRPCYTAVGRNDNMVRSQQDKSVEFVLFCEDLLAHKLDIDLNDWLEK